MEFIITGGVWWTVPILIIGLTSVVLICISAINAVNNKKIAPRLLDGVLFLGFLGLAWGILGQIIGMFQAAGAIVSAGEISPNLIWAGFRVSLITVIMGFVVLLISSVGWFLLRPFRNR